MPLVSLESIGGQLYRQNENNTSTFYFCKQNFNSSGRNTVYKYEPECFIIATLNEIIYYLINTACSLI